MSAKTPEKFLQKLRAYPVFCQKVWLECRKVPRGKTLSYSELARRIGRPGAARAVGTALAKNPFAPHVPCHRVVRKDGGMGGYSGPGGIRTKLKILRKESSKR